MQILIRDYGRRRLKELDEHNRRRLMKVTENVEKGGAVLKMVSSSTGFIKGMMELGLQVAAVANPAVNDRTTVSLDADVDEARPPPPSQPANGPSFAQTPVVGDAAAAGRFGKGLAWLRQRCRRNGAASSSTTTTTTPAKTSSGGRADRYWWRRDDEPSTTAPNADGVDRTTAADTSPAPPPSTSPGVDGRRDAGVGRRRVFEKRSKWLKRSGRVADSDDVDDAGSTAAAAVAGFCDDRPSDEKHSVEISVISDGQSNAVDSPTGEAVDHCPARRERCAEPPSDAEVVLDPAGLASTRTLPLADGQSEDRQTPISHDLRPSADITQPPSSSPPCHAADDGVHVITPDSTASDQASADHLGQSQTPAPSLSEVDRLCGEIGRLVADYVHQHLASIIVYTRSIRQASV